MYLVQAGVTNDAITYVLCVPSLILKQQKKKSGKFQRPGMTFPLCQPSLTMKNGDFTEKLQAISNGHICAQMYHACHPIKLKKK